MGPHPGNERGLAQDAGGAGITTKITPPARCNAGAWRGKTRPAPPCNELDPCPCPCSGPCLTHTPDRSLLKIGCNKRGPIQGMTAGGPWVGAGQELPQNTPAGPV